MRLRLATIDDAEAVADIYNHEVLTSTAVSDIEPRTLEAQRAWIAERSGAHAVVVAELVDSDVAGFGSLSRYKDRPAYATTVESSVYVAAKHRGKGVGAAIIDELISVARTHGFHTIIARIEASNTASIALHTQAGFEPIGTEREVGRKFGRWLNMCSLQKML